MHKKILKTLLFFLFSSQLFSIDHDKTELQELKWKNLIFSESKSTISKVYDENKNKKVLKFKGQSTKSAYQLINIKKNNFKTKLLSWEVKYEQDVIFIIRFNTHKGQRTFIYTTGNTNLTSNIFGLRLKPFIWNTIKLNLQQDLDQVEQNNQITSIIAFVMKGNMLLNDFSLYHQQASIKINKKTLNKKTLKKYTTKKSSNAPEIKLKGKKILFLKLGNSFTDPGVTAWDKEDGYLNFTTSSTLDINKIGNYSVLYITKDKDGNFAANTRTVIVKKDLTKMVENDMVENDINVIQNDMIESDIDLIENATLKKLHQDTIKTIEAIQNSKREIDSMNFN